MHHGCLAVKLGLAVALAWMAAAASWAFGPIVFTSATGESIWLTRDGGPIFSGYRDGDEQARIRITPDGVILLSKGHPDNPGPFPLSYGLQIIEQQDGERRAMLELNTKLAGGITLDSAEGPEHVHVSIVIQDCMVKFINETAGAMSVFYEVPVLGAPC